MQKILKLTWEDCEARVEGLGLSESDRVYGVPRGGTVVAYLCNRYEGVQIVEEPSEATVIVDDIIDSGATEERYCRDYEARFAALVDKRKPEWAGQWVCFPWEHEDPIKDNADHVARIIELCGDNPAREGMRETPKRYLKALQELTSGLHEDPAEHLRKWFPLGDTGDVSNYDEVILSKDIPFVSLCEHHMMPFYGKATIGYIPKEGGRVVGLSKIARMFDGYARRFQVQERLTRQALDAMVRELEPLGAGVVIESTHTCQCWRGVKKDGSMITSALSGIFLQSVDARTEFMALARG